MSPGTSTKQTLANGFTFAAVVALPRTDDRLTVFEFGAVKATPRLALETFPGQRLGFLCDGRDGQRSAVHVDVSFYVGRRVVLLCTLEPLDPASGGVSPRYRARIQVGHEELASEDVTVDLSGAQPMNGRFWGRAEGPMCSLGPLADGERKDLVQKLEREHKVAMPS